jgi:hypothetical protein
VHDRAHAALAVLAPQEARELAPEHREEIGDYLLGQPTGAADGLRTRSLLDGSVSARAWANAIADQIEPLASSPLPAIPGRDNGRDPLASPPQRARPRSSSLERAAASLPSSRRAGAALLAVVAAIIAVVVVLVTSGGGSHKRASSAGSTSAPAGSSTAASGARATETKRITLTSPSPASKAVGVAAVLNEGSNYAFYLAAERLPPSKGFFYAVWLYNSPSSHEALSKSPPVGSDGRLQGGSLLPADAAKFHQMILTKETQERPSQPGPIVLRGSFGLH